MKALNTVVGIILLIFVVSCSTTTIEPKAIEVNPYNELFSQFAFKGRIYSIEGNTTPAEKIKKEIGQIEEIVGDIKENGQAKLFNSKIDNLERAKIFSIRDVEKKSIVAVKIEDIYYTAIYWGKLK